MGTDNKRLNPLLTWLWDLMSYFSVEEIRIPTEFHDQVMGVRDILMSDTSGIVNSILDYAINRAAVDFTIETDQENFSNILSEWFDKINISLVGRVPTGLKALSKEYYRERWKASSLIVLRTIWEKVEIQGQKFNLPTKMWLADGENVIIENASEKTRVIGTEKYSLKINDQDRIKLPTKENEEIYVQKPFNSWSALYPTPFLIQRGIYKNLMFYALLNKKSEKFIGKALEYMLLMKKGTEQTALKGAPEFIYSEEDLKKVKEDFSKTVQSAKTDPGIPSYITNFDTELSDYTPDYARGLNTALYAPIEKRLLAGLGLIEIVEGVASSRREGILNPKPFIGEVEDGIVDFQALIRDVVLQIIEKNKAAHPKFFSQKIQFHNTPIRDFISDGIRDHLRSMYDRGVLSKQTYSEVVGGNDIDIEASRRIKETDKKYDDVFYPPVINNQEQYQNADKFPPAKKDTIPTKKQGPEAKNFKGEIEEEEVVEISKIVKRKDGYHVISEKTGKNLGGPYKTKKEAVKRLRQVEYFKHQGKTEEEIASISIEVEKDSEDLDSSINK